MAIEISTVYGVDITGDPFEITGINVPNDATVAILLILGAWMTGGGDHIDISNFDEDADDHFVFINAGTDTHTGRHTAGAYYLKYGETGFPTRGGTGLTLTISLTSGFLYGQRAVLFFLSGTVTDGTLIIGSDATTIADDDPEWTSEDMGDVGPSDLAFIAAAQYQTNPNVAPTGSGQTALASGTTSSCRWAVGYEFGEDQMTFTVASSSYQGGVAFAIKAVTGGGSPGVVLTMDHFNGGF